MIYMYLFRNFLVLFLFSTLISISTVYGADRPEVASPKLTTVEKPIRMKKESESAFYERVQALHERRIQELYPIQKKFRLDVEARNRHLPSNQKLQSPSLIDPFDPLFLAYKDRKPSKHSNDALEKMLKEKQQKLSDKKSWLFIIAIEDYKYADPVLFASRTSDIVRATFQKKLDISDRNIVVLRNEEATLKNINDEIRKLSRRVQRNDVIYFYYCGHGLSNKRGEQLILPYDGMPDFADTKNTIKIERLYNRFLNSRALRTFSFVDTSFSGVTDGITLLKGLQNPLMRPRAEGYHKRLNILNSTRSHDTANAYYAKGYRLFSYYLGLEVLSKPQNAGELFDNIRTKIREVSASYGEGRVQEPEFFGYRELTIRK